MSDGAGGAISTTYAGLRVLDLSTNLAGPLAAMVLGDLGADVVKIERPGGGDDTRALPPHSEEGSAIFRSVNRNKRSVELDVSAPDGREALLRLVADADVVVESFGPGVAEKLGLTFGDLRKRNPEVVVCSISAYGRGEIGRRLPGYDGLIQAFTGMMSFNGHPDGPPARVAPSAVDISTGLWAVVAIQAALRRRAQRREGEHLEIALVDTAMTLMGHQVLATLMTGEAPVRLGSGTAAAAPYEAFEAADGTLMLAVANDGQWKRLCDALELGDLAADPSLTHAPGRVVARERIRARVAERIATDRVESWLERLTAARVPAARVADLPDALSHPLVAERGLLVEPGGDPGAGPLLRLPIDPDGSCVRRRPPALGEHTDEVLGATRPAPEQGGATPRAEAHPGRR